MKRIFLTGASSGIGLATARTLTDRGHHVWGTSRALARLPELLNFHPVELDLSSNASVATAFESAAAEAAGFDVVINNAGSGHFGPAELLSPEALNREFQVLVFGQIELVRRATAAMRASGSGLIINISSLASRIPVPFMASYNAAKAALATFTMSLQLELRGSGVKIVDLQPADIRTAFNQVATHLASRGSAYESAVEKTWQVVEQNMRNAPGPELVARRIVQLIATEDPPPQVTVGDFFQSRIAPFLLRLLPLRLQLWGIRKYYGL
jgi:short-subunit dehydrogenase